MTAEEREEREFAVRMGVETLAGSRPEVVWNGLLALRSVAFHLRLEGLRQEIDNQIKKMTRREV